MQVDARASRAGPLRQASSAYLMSWVAMAAFGLGYIGVAATRPDLLGAILPLAEPAQEQVVAGRAAADIADELATTMARARPATMVSRAFTGPQNANAATGSQSAPASST